MSESYMDATEQQLTTQAKERETEDDVSAIIDGFCDPPPATTTATDVSPCDQCFDGTEHLDKKKQPPAGFSVQALKTMTATATESGPSTSFPGWEQMLASSASTLQHLEQQDVSSTIPYIEGFELNVNAPTTTTTATFPSSWATYLEPEPIATQPNPRTDFQAHSAALLDQQLIAKLCQQEGSAGSVAGATTVHVVACDGAPTLATAAPAYGSIPATATPNNSASFASEPVATLDSSCSRVPGATTVAVGANDGATTPTNGAPAYVSAPAAATPHNSASLASGHVAALDSLCSHSGNKDDDVISQQKAKISDSGTTSSNPVVEHWQLVNDRNRNGISMSLKSDHTNLSAYMIKVRQSLEFFEASHGDAAVAKRGRKKRIHLGQIGIRCLHCKHTLVGNDSLGSTYYPGKIAGVYQAVQNMAKVHLHVSCPEIPSDVKADFVQLRQRGDTSSGGKKYWTDSCMAIGLYETSSGIFLKPK